MFRHRHLYVIKTGAYKIEQTEAKDIPKENGKKKTIYVIHLFLKREQKRMKYSWRGRAAFMVLPGFPFTNKR